MPRILAILAALLALGCKDECDSRRCHPIDADAEPGDTLIDVDSDFSLASFEIEGRSSEIRLVGGGVAVFDEDLACIASADHPCTLTLRHLRFEIDSSRVDTTDGTLSLERPTIAVQGPLDLVDSGFGFVIPTGTLVQTCMTVDGRSDSARAPLGTPATLNLDGVNHGLAIEGVFPVRFRGGEDQCTAFDGSVNIAASGEWR